VDAIEQAGVRGHGGGFEIEAYRDAWFCGVAILRKPFVEMRIVCVVEAHSAVKEQRKRRIGGPLSVSGCTGSQQSNHQKSPPFHALKVEKKGAYNKQITSV